LWLGHVDHPVLTLPLTVWPWIKSLKLTCSLRLSPFVLYGPWNSRTFTFPTGQDVVEPGGAGPQRTLRPALLALPRR